MKRFLYLVQTKSELPPSYAPLRGDDSDLLVLTWGVETAGCIYLPRSTWTQGRNRLRAEALRADRADYLYYIFLDDDMVLSQGDWRQFERLLLKYEPAIAVPYSPGYPGMGRSKLSLEAHRCIAFDAMFCAFHREVFRDNLILPYREEFDAQSWWFSQWFVIQLSRLFLARDTIQINAVHVENVHHGDYPREADFRAMQEKFYHDVTPFGRGLGRLLTARSTATFYLALVRLTWLFWHRWHLPRRHKTGSYVIPGQKRRRRLDVSAEFWRDRL